MAYATLAEYLDSTPERRARRDAMIAMCDEIRDPWKHIADADGFISFAHRVNYVTGELLAEPGQIHKDDFDWLAGLWRDVDELEYRVTLAKLARA